MTEQTVYCEECLEDIPASEIYVDDNRLYCKQCGSELESPDRDLFEQIVENQGDFLFRGGDEDGEDEDDSEFDGMSEVKT